MTSPDFSAADAAVAGVTLAMSQTASSPVVGAKGKGIDFYEALIRIHNGKRVTRLEWQDPEYYCLMHDYRLCLHKPDGKIYSWIINDGDMAGEDWVIL